MTPLARLLPSFIICIAVLLGTAFAPTQLQKLTVEITSFEAVTEGENTVVLSWQTASETNNKGFEVQRLLGEDDWAVLGFIEGAGTTTEAQAYRYTAENVPAGTQQFRLKQVDIDGDSTFTDTVSVNVLPVELVGFEGSVTKQGARLTWQTASETNNAGFEVQRQKENGWTQVGYVDSKAQGGTTTETKSYSYTAENLPVGTHQFRLRQVDLDGSSTLTDPVTVDIQMQEAVKLTAPVPNPVSGTASLSFAVKEQTETTVTLYNTLGQRVATLYAGTPQAGEQQRTQLDATGLSSGTYFLRLQAGAHTTTRQVTVVR